MSIAYKNHARDMVLTAFQGVAFRVDGQFHANSSLEGKIKSEPILKGDCSILKIKICSFQIKIRFLPTTVVQILQQFDLSVSFRISHTKFSVYFPQLFPYLLGFRTQNFLSISHNFHIF